MWILLYARTGLRVLERLLITCPDLRVFNAVIQIDPTTQHEGSNVNEEEEKGQGRKGRQRIIDNAAKDCPKLDRYSFHVIFCDSDKEDLGDMIRTFPNLKMQSIAFSSNLDAVSDDALALQDLLGEITVLEIRSILWYCQDPDMLNKILCLTRSLLHLIASEAGLHLASLQPQDTRAEPLRQKLLVDFAGYINRYRLFRNLPMLNFPIPSLKIGQRMIFANTRAAAATSSGIEFQLRQPVRHPNELLTLLCLEECTLRAENVPGMIAANNFKFLDEDRMFPDSLFSSLQHKHEGVEEDEGEE
ncbi:hypothetical protein EC957_007894 [Mortierella hygrophila]|uniref:Uncharacterized protein n=1 Tax=Mortierella hygrophila TaxID=979708 RepID=A0A9P6FD88_9FUNG|nr:hypothetical protein EC957_007894 [Mortierella hygrophila]